ncbi:MAG: hypothetical protein IKL43_09500 [Alistipes sp.]|nr:hypothetical protein [Alistipes sp.]MBR3591220.1 hypothetical protein [Alistipes sp.]
MKNLFKNLMLVAVAAMAFVACSQDVNDINILPKQTTLNFTARFVDDTRAYFGEKGEEGYPVYWAGGESVRFVAPGADYDGTYETRAEAVKADEQGIEATFDVVFNNPIKAGTVYAYLGDGWNPMSNYAYVNNSQTPTATSVDPKCIMASTSFEYDGETMEVSGDFAHGAGYGKMTINGFEGKTISSVELNFAGTNYCNYTLNVADIAEHTFWFASEENEVSNFTISVVVDGVSYSKEVEIGSDKHLYFKKGLVSKFSVSGLVKDPIQLEMPIVTTSFANGKVTVSWNAIENAESYTVKVDGTVVEEEYKDTSYSFDATYGTYYNISVIANAAEGSVDYLDSYEAYTSITTPLDINMVTDYTVTLTNYTIDPTSSYGKLFRFTSDDATKWINLPVNPKLNDVLPAGTYTGVYGNWSYSSDASLEFNHYDTLFNYDSMYVNSWATSKSAVEVIRESDDVWSITIIVTTGDSRTIKYVYSEDGEDPEPIGDSFTYLGRYYDIDSDDSTSGGGYMYKVVAGGVEYTLEIYWAYANADGAIKVGTYNYCTNMPDWMNSSWAGFSIISDSYYYDSTLAVTADGVVTLTLKDADGNLIGEYVYEGVAVFE